MGRFGAEVRATTWPLPVAELIQRGVSRHVLAGPSWLRTSPGFYRPYDAAPPTTAQRIVDAAAALPAGGTIGGWAAGYVHGVDQFDGLDDHTMELLPVPVLSPTTHRRSVNSIRYVQTERSYPLQLRHGILVTTPVATTKDLARWAKDLVESVVAVDAMLSAEVVSRAELAALHPLRGPNSKIANRALELGDDRVRSAGESRLRMFWVIDLGLPTPLVNRPVFDLDGQFLGTPDLLDEEAGLVLEYDGSRWPSTITAGHRDVDQHRRDNHREERLERANLIVVRADKVDLSRERSQLKRRIRSARADGLRRERARDRWTLEPPRGWMGISA